MGQGFIAHARVLPLRARCCKSGALRLVLADAVAVREGWRTAAVSERPAAARANGKEGTKGDKTNLRGDAGLVSHSLGWIERVCLT
jgi:hypothetical protein